jgi:hypothetical protein
VIDDGNQLARAKLPIRWHRRGRGASIGGLHVLFDAAVVVLACYILLASVIDLLREYPSRWDAALLLTLNGAMSCLGFIMALRRVRPIFLFVFFFDFIFLSIGPLQQLTIFEDPIYGDSQLVDFAILLCCAFSTIGLPFVLRGQIGISTYSARSVSHSIYDGRFEPLVLFFVSVALGAGLFAFYWPVLLTTREAMYTLMEQTFDKSVSILFLSFLNPLCFVSAYIGWTVALRCRANGWVIAFSLCLLLAIVVNNPVNFARFRFSTLIIFAFLLQFGVQRIRMLATILIIGTLLSGYFNEFRYDFILNDSAMVKGGYFATMDYHVLNIVCYAIKYTVDAGYSYGSNILSAILFFLPRAMWEGKAEHTAFYFFDLIRKYRYYGTDNLASPIVAEGYFAFGLPGAILLSVIVLYGLRVIERLGMSARPGSPWNLVLCISPMLSLILMRGPLIVGFSEICGHIAAVLTGFALLRASADLKPRGVGAGRVTANR